MSEAKPHLEGKAQSDCVLCGSQGTVVYHDLPDTVFANVAGTWDIRCCDNADCGLMWLDPMPKAEELGKAYNSYYTHAQECLPERGLKKAYHRLKASYQTQRYGYPYPYDDTPAPAWQTALLSLHPPRKTELDFPFTYLADMPKGRLLEVGFGSGEMLDKLSTWGWQVEGIDFDPTAVANAKARGLNVRQGDFLAEAPAQYDVIFLNHVWEHLPEPIAMLKACAERLSSGGRLLIAQPNSAAYGLDVYQQHWLALDVPRHVYLYQAKTLRRLAENCGLDSTKIQIHSSVLHGVDVFKCSESLARYQRLAADDLGKFAKIKAELRWFWAWLQVKLGKNNGEEIHFIYQKP